jgi:hypothetical protein
MEVVGFVQNVVVVLLEHGSGKVKTKNVSSRCAQIIIKKTQNEENCY